MRIQVKCATYRKCELTQIQQLCEWIKCALDRIKSFKKCGISNSLDSCKDDLHSHTNDDNINLEGSYSSSEAYQPVTVSTVL
jgi:hypothetical protein